MTQLQLAPLAAGLRLAQRLLQPGGLVVEVADRLAHLLEQGLRAQVGLSAALNLLFDLPLALGDALGQVLDLSLPLIERRLGGLDVDLARLLVRLQQPRQRFGQSLGRGPGGRLADRGREVGLRRRLGLPFDQQVNEDADYEQGYGKNDRHATQADARPRRNRCAATPISPKAGERDGIEARFACFPFARLNMVA